jgi:hypothetical protein
MVGIIPEFFGEDTADFNCSRNLILVNATFDGDLDALHSMQLLVSFKMSMCMLLFMYVLYSLCRIAFNYKQRDDLTTAIQCLFCASLFCNSVPLNKCLVRSCQIASNLIAKNDHAGILQSYTFYCIFFYLADFCFEFAILCQMCLW